MLAEMLTSRIGQLRDTNMKCIFALLAFCFTISTAQAAEPSLVLVGHFTNQKISSGDDPHILSGYSVSLYRSGDKLVGNVGIGIGAPEPAKAILYNITIDDKTQKLSFKSKYSAGRDFAKGIGPERRESRIVMSFIGLKTPTSLTGTFTLTDGYCTDKAGSRTRAVLKKTSDDFVPTSYEEWVKLTGLPPAW